MTENTGVPTIYPMYLENRLRVMFVIGSWWLVYYTTYLFVTLEDILPDGELYKQMRDSSFVVYLTNGTWIAYTILLLIDKEEIDRGEGMDRWNHNYYVVAALGVLSAEIMCYGLYSISNRLFSKSEVKKLKSS